MQNTKITGTDLAKLAGVSRNAVSKLAMSGKLIRDKDKKFDLSNPVNRAYLKYHNSADPVPRKEVTKEHEKKTKKKTAKNPTKKPTKDTKKKSVPKVGHLDSDDYDGETDLSDVSGMALLPRNDLERYKIITDIETKQVKNEKFRDKLVSRELVQRVFAKLYSVDSNEFKNLGMNLSPEIAAITGNDSPETTIKINEAIDKECYSILDHIKRIIDDFLEEIGAEKN